MNYLVPVFMIFFTTLALRPSSPSQANLSNLAGALGKLQAEAALQAKELLKKKQEEELKKKQEEEKRKKEKEEKLKKLGELKKQYDEIKTKDEEHLNKQKITSGLGKKIVTTPKPRPHTEKEKEVIKQFEKLSKEMELEKTKEELEKTSKEREEKRKKEEAEEKKKEKEKKEAEKRWNDLKQSLQENVDTFKELRNKMGPYAVTYNSPALELLMTNEVADKIGWRADFKALTVKLSSENAKAILALLNIDEQKDWKTSAETLKKRVGAVKPPPDNKQALKDLQSFIDSKDKKATVTPAQLLAIYDLLLPPAPKIEEKKIDVNVEQTVKDAITKAQTDNKKDYEEFQQNVKEIDKEEYQEALKSLADATKINGWSTAMATIVKKLKKLAKKGELEKAGKDALSKIEGIKEDFDIKKPIFVGYTLLKELAITLAKSW